ncbi:MAG: hypothetical protein DRP28_03520, partial [Thermodesulfobacteriota bacterium]
MYNRLLYLFCVLVFAFIFLASPVCAMMSIEEEREMRDKLLRMVESQVPLIKDPEIVGYVSDIGQKVLDQV